MFILTMFADDKFLICQHWTLNLVSLKLTTLKNGRKTITLFWMGRSQSSSSSERGRVLCSYSPQETCSKCWEWQLEIDYHSSDIRNLFFQVLLKPCLLCEHSERTVCQLKAINILCSRRLLKPCTHMCNAGPALYTTTADRDKIRGFLWRAVRLRYRSVHSPTFDNVIADDRQFERVSMEII